MTIEEKKKQLCEYIAQLEEEIEILKGNIAEFKKILEKIQTDDDLEKYKDFDIENGCEVIISYKRDIIDYFKKDFDVEEIASVEALITIYDFYVE